MVGLAGIGIALYALAVVALALVGAGKTPGLGVRWERILMVERYGILK
ncbi:hypothetical protein BH11GEM1_BH11GEM1_19500 [soil metagenome]